MIIPFNDLRREFVNSQDEYEKQAINVLRSGKYILGDELACFEQEFADYCGAAYAAGVDNGLNALVLALRALEIGPEDEVILQSNSYIATVMSVTMNGATPVFTEPDQFFNIDVELIQSKISAKTKAIIVTHLYGQAANMSALENLCFKNHLHLIEDCAQAHGAKHAERRVGSFGTGCFSFYPTKNLGCFGDGGAIVSSDSSLINKIKVLRNYGSEKRYYNEVVGYNSRLDEMQASLLRIKLKKLDTINEARSSIAMKYLKHIKNSKVELPSVLNKSTSVWHLFVVKCKNRTELQNFLTEYGIQTVIHYPLPPHLSEAYKYLGFKRGDLPVAEQLADSVLSLPIFFGMTEHEIFHVTDTINKF